MTKQCQVCGKEFKSLNWNIEHGFGLYCSRSCAAKIRIGNKNSNWRGGTAKRECIVCGKLFIPVSRDKRRNTKYCSLVCRGKDKSLEKNSNWRGGRRSGRKGYERDLVMGTKNYRVWKTSVYERDNKTCVLCNKKNKTMVAHHIYNYSTYPQLRYDINNGITLCQSCHSGISWHEDEFIPYFLMLINPSETKRETLEKHISSEDIVRSTMRIVEPNRNALAVQE